MGLWNLYFVLKLSLFFADLIDFHVWLNLALALALLVPVPAGIWRWLRLAVAIPVAVVLLYHDTRFPPFERLTAQAGYLQQFSADYIMELLARFIHIETVAICLAVILASVIASRKLRLTSFVLLAIFPVVPLYQYVQNIGPVTIAGSSTGNGAGAGAGIAPPGATGKPDDQALSQSLAAFYKAQATRQVVMPAASGQAFDLIVLQVCSMAWDDLQLAGMDNNPLMQRFDLLFRQFNTATSYSGPAAIRLLRATCGQTPHSALYEPVPADCHLFEALAGAGFEPRMQLNHDGRFGDMTTEIQRYGGLNVSPGSLEGLPVLGQAFDGTLIKDDYEVLSHWFRTRLQSPSQRVALYYNTNSLHDGNHPVGSRKDANSAAGYAKRLHKLFEDLDRFMSELETSGRKVVLVVIPEHGAGSRGDRMQIPFMRENPSPAITLAPVGVRLIGMPKTGQATEITQPASYIDLAGLLRDIIRDNPYDGGTSVATLASSIGSTPHVAENDGSVVVRYGPDYYLRYKDSAWTDYRY